MKQQNVIAMPVGHGTAGTAVSAARFDAWTLVDYLFPSERRPVWSGSVSNERGMILPKTA